MALTPYVGIGAVVTTPQRVARQSAGGNERTVSQGNLLPLTRLGVGVVGTLLIPPELQVLREEMSCYVIQYQTMPSTYKVEGSHTGGGYVGPRIFPPPHSLQP